MRKTKTWTLIAAAVIMTGLSGCGRSSEKIDTGMDQIASFDYGGAIETFNQAIEEGEDKELAYRGQGLAYMGLTDYANAVSSFENALENAGLFPSETETDINFYLATSQYRSGQYQDAIATLDAIAGLKEKRYEVYFLRGSVRLEIGETDKAIEDLNLALYYSNHDTGMTIKIYQVLDNAGKKEEGRAYLSHAIEERLSSMSDYEKGIIYYYLEDYENARDNLEAYRGGGNNDSDTLLMLGKTYEMLGDSNYAAGLYQKYLNENESVAQIWNQLGLCRIRTGQYQDALSAFNSGLAMEDNASVLQELKFNQIAAYEYIGDFDKAATLMRDYLNDYPDHEEAKREYTFLQSR